MGAALVLRPVRMPDRATKALGAPNLGYTFVEGASISTDDGDVDIYVDEFPEPILP